MTMENPFASKAFILEEPREEPRKETLKRLSESEHSTADAAFRALGREYVELTLNPTRRGPMTREAGFQNRLSQMVYKFGLDRDLSKYLQGMVSACRMADPRLSRMEDFQWRLDVTIKGALGPVKEARHWETQPIPKGGKRFIGFNDHLDAAYATDLVTVNEAENGARIVRLHQLKVTERGAEAEKVETSLTRMENLLARLGDREKYFESASRAERARLMAEAKELVRANTVDHVVLENAETLDALFHQDPPPSPTDPKFEQLLEESRIIPARLALMVRSGHWDRMTGLFLDFVPSTERALIEPRLPKWTKLLEAWVALFDLEHSEAVKERMRKEEGPHLIDRQQGTTFEAIVAVYDDNLRRNEKARIPLTP